MKPTSVYIGDSKQIIHLFHCRLSSSQVRKPYLNSQMPADLEAGLTLIYCTWLAPKDRLNVANPISDCNIMLYVMTERWPAARKYRDIFEQIKNIVEDVIAGESHEATREAGILDSKVTKSCRVLDQSLSGGARSDYSRMINHMAADQPTTPLNLVAKIPDSRLKDHEIQEIIGISGCWSEAVHGVFSEQIQVPVSTASVFMNGSDDFEDFEATGWNLAMWEGPNAFI